MGILKYIFGAGAEVDYSELIKTGAVILDVRSKGEYASGHIIDSINIPVGELEENLYKLKDKDKTIITCCASGARSASAKSILKLSGYTHVYNGGSWSGLSKKIK
jgi:phage shock protein E